MIHIKYLGRTGNNIYQMIIGYYFSEKTNQKISNPLKNYIKFNNENKEDKQYQENFVISDSNINKIENISLNKNIIIKGFFQEPELIKSISQFILEKSSLIVIPPKYKENYWVLHLRLDDFNHEGHNTQVIDPQYYISILEKEKPSKIFLIFDFKGKKKFNYLRKKENKYVSALLKYNLVVDKNSNKNEDIAKIYYAKNIICSNSTFIFWPVFYSQNNKDKIYCPSQITKKNNNNFWKSINKAIFVHNSFLDLSK